jgi:hypothetical protein
MNDDIILVNPDLYISLMMCEGLSREEATAQMREFYKSSHGCYPEDDHTQYFEKNETALFGIEPFKPF